MFKSFVLKQLLKSKLKNIPEAEQDKIIAVVEKNPDLFMKIATEIQEKTKSGVDQMSAAMEVMRTHEEEIKKIVS